MKAKLAHVIKDGLVYVTRLRLDNAINIPSDVPHRSV